MRKRFGFRNGSALPALSEVERTFRVLFRRNPNVNRIRAQGGLGEFASFRISLILAKLIAEIFAGPTRPGQQVGSVRLLRQNPLDSRRLGTSR
jgi:hypothetical protein